VAAGPAERTPTSRGPSPRCPGPPFSPLCPKNENRPVAQPPRRACPPRARPPRFAMTFPTGGHWCQWLSPFRIRSGRGRPRGTQRRSSPAAGARPRGPCICRRRKRKFRRKIQSGRVRRFPGPPLTGQSTIGLMPSAPHSNLRDPCGLRKEAPVTFGSEELVWRGVGGSARPAPPPPPPPPPNIRPTITWMPLPESRPTLPVSRRPHPKNGPGEGPRNFVDFGTFFRPVAMAVREDPIARAGIGRV